MKHNSIHNKKWMLCILLISLIAFTGCGKENNANTNENQTGAESSNEATNKGSSEDETPVEIAEEITKTTVTFSNENYKNFINNEEIQAEAIKAGNIKNFDSIYNTEYQQAVASAIETYKSKEEYTIENPLMILNPYGTSTTGLYVYFKTQTATSVEYTVSVDSDEIPDFTRILYTNQAGEAVTEQEGILVGLVPGMKNTVTLKAYDVDGKEVGTSVFTINVENFGTVKETILAEGSPSNSEALADGLFVLFGYDRRNMDEPRHLLFYDNYGVIRAEIPLDIKYADFRIENVDGYLLFPCTDNQFTLMSPTGKIMAIYEADGYMFHHDFAYDANDNKLVVLANKLSKETKEDIVLTLDLNTGEWSETLDFETLLTAAFERSTKPESEKKLDWLHLNTIMIVDSNDVIVSSRELSSIIRVNDIYGTPTVEYIIAEPSVWEGTGYEDLLLTQVGEFSNTGGQHTVTYLEDESLEEGQYYLYMFNNNYGISVTFPEYDWTTIEGIGTPGAKPEGSYYYKYLVNSNEGYYELVDSFLVPYSRIVASSQHYDDHIVICSGVNGTFGEYDINGNLIAEFKMDVDEFTYRTMKYSMNQFWFNSELATTAGERDIEKEFVQGVVGNEESDESEFNEFEDYSSSESNVKGNDYSDFE